MDFKMPYKVGKHCSTCHSCFYACPIGAIRFVGREYAIDEKLCISCGQCAEVCPSGIIYDAESNRTPTPHAPIEYSCDAVVVGAGGSGLIAAVKLAEETGKKIIVLEKAPKPGGNTNLGHAFVLRYSKLHEKAGFPDTRDDAVDIISKNSDISKPLLRRAMYALTDFFDWLGAYADLEKYFKLKDLRHIGSMGPFPAVSAMMDFPIRTKNIESTDQSMGPGWAGSFVVDTLLAQCARLGITLLTGHRAKRLVIDENGRFRAVEAHDGAGDVIINASCCLLASGGFSRNKDIMDTVRPSFYEDFPIHTFSVASCTGDAIEMVSAQGGAIDLENVKIPMFGPTHHPYRFSLVRLAEGMQAIQVDARGKRFRNEAAPTPDGPYPLSSIMESLPGHIAYTIFDSKARDIMGPELLERAHDDDMRRCMTPWREDLEYECGLDLAAKKANSISELAQAIGLDPEKLLAEVERYNGFCATGSDDDFSKDAPFLMPIAEPPFYALFLSRFNEGAEGGVVNDDNLRVMKKDGSPFHGLYAAGDCCRGVLKKSDVGGKFGEMPWAMASGYLAAGEMQEYLCAGDAR